MIQLLFWKNDKMCTVIRIFTHFNSKVLSALWRLCPPDPPGHQWGKAVRPHACRELSISISFILAFRHDKMLKVLFYDRTVQICTVWIARVTVLPPSLTSHNCFFLWTNSCMQDATGRSEACYHRLTVAADMNFYLVQLQLPFQNKLCRGIITSGS